MNTYNYFKSNYNITIITHTHIYIYPFCGWDELRLVALFAASIMGLAAVKGHP
jgi:hypothetical protein